MILGVFWILAELERDMIRERTSMWKLRKAKEGYYVWWWKPALGFKFIKEWKWTKLQIIEEEQKLVNTIFELYVNEKNHLVKYQKY
jgi:DNA invertase Pin-like site-specific DNA recombinase